MLTLIVEGCRDMCHARCTGVSCPPHSSFQWHVHSLSHPSLLWCCELLEVAVGCGVAAPRLRLGADAEEHGSGFAEEALGSPVLPGALQAAVRRLGGRS